MRQTTMNRLARLEASGPLQGNPRLWIVSTSKEPQFVEVEGRRVERLAVELLDDFKRRVEAMFPHVALFVAMGR